MSTAELHIGLILPDVLGTYGDDGNALVLRQRARMRGVNAEILPIRMNDAVPDSLDIYTVGGGEDVAQILAAEHLIADGGLSRAAAAHKPILAICAGLQIFGSSFRASGRMVEGLGLLDIYTTSLGKRMIGELVSEPQLPAITQAAEVLSTQDMGVDSQGLLTGFANHMGATILGPDAQPLGTRRRGVGNTDENGIAEAQHLFSSQAASANAPAEALDLSSLEAQITYEGVVQGSIIATYMHGPVLARNPHLADYLLAQAMRCEVKDLPALQGAPAQQLAQEIAVLRHERLKD